MFLQAQERHRKKISLIQKELKRLLPENSPLHRKRHSSLQSHMTSLFQPSSKKATVDFQNLKEIIEIDPIQKIVWTEPGVTMEKLCKYTLKHGLIPSVVPEFKGITVGGAIMGSALESSSFKHGQFGDICEEYELLLGNGELAIVDAQKEPALFYGISGSYGTIAHIASAKIRLKPSKKFVKIHYDVFSPSHNMQTVWNSFRQREYPPEYLDAAILEDEKIIVMSATPLSREQLPSNTFIKRFSRPWSPWFCQNIVENAKLFSLSKNETTDCLPLYDYLFRYDRAAFWMGQYITSKPALWRYLLEWFLSSPKLSQTLCKSFRSSPPSLTPKFLFRLLFGWKLSSRKLYRILHKLPEETLSSTFILQDFYIPTEKTHAFLSHIKKLVRIFPIWLCPVKGSATSQFLSPHYLKDKKNETIPEFTNVGIYGTPQEQKDIPRTAKELENLAKSLGGRKMLYSKNSYSEKEFWEIYDKKRYEKLRQKYHSEERFLDLYARTHP